MLIVVLAGGSVVTIWFIHMFTESGHGCLKTSDIRRSYRTKIDAGQKLNTLNHAPEDGGTGGRNTERSMC